MITILSSASARPNFVKLAAVHHALKDRKDVRHVIVHTGQHYDPFLSDIFFQQLDIDQPKYNLGVKGGVTREDTIEATAKAFKDVLNKEKPDIVLVYGDVNGAVGAARAAKKLGIKIGHVEAGLRSRDMDMPEEHNRIEIDQIADELFITEKSAEENIRKEKLKGRVHFVGNTMIDTLVRMLPIIETQAHVDHVKGISFAIATLHRPSNVDTEAVLTSNIAFLKEIAKHTQIHLPGHPRLLAALKTYGVSKEDLFKDGVSIVESYAYIQFLRLMQLSDFILTDSGGIQEEAAFLGKRCFTMRRNTERPSTIESGSNVLIDPSKEEDRQKVLEFAKNPQKISVKIPEKWDGKAGERIAEVLLAQ